MNTTAPPILEHLSALGDATRTRILVLLEENELNVSELCAALKLPQPSVSRHLRTLADDGWVSARAEGRNRHYRMAEALAPDSVELWRLVRGSLGDDGIYALDAERVRAVLKARRGRSAEFFASSAGRWEQLRRDLFGERAELLALFGLLDPRWTLGDLGAGTGSLAAALAPFVARVVCVDRSPEMLAAAAARLERHANVAIRAGELDALPIADEELDVAVLSLVLHYLIDPRAALAEARRALEPGGRVLVVEMSAHERAPELAEEMGHVWPGFDPAEMERWLVESGFEQVRSQALPPDARASCPHLFLATGVRPGRRHRT